MPRRRCVGCGRVAPKAQLVRIALAQTSAGGQRMAVLDRHATMPGRGAYLCRAQGAPQVAAPAASCLRRATRRGALARTLRASVSLDPKLVESPVGADATAPAIGEPDARDPITTTTP